MADRFLEIAQTAIKHRGRFSVALAGGSTPKRVYELLADDERSDKVAWPKVHIFFGDERCVPPDHADSNFRMAREAMLSHLDIPAQNIHRMKGEGDPHESARIYEIDLRSFFGDVEWPRFDLILLGMGDDGHTASLFPNTEALAESSAWIVTNPVEKFNAYRLTLTAPAINHAAHIMFIVTGAAKADRLVEVLTGTYEPARLPAQMISPADGALDWFLDQSSATKLQHP